ncbi:hypothetical protein N665_0217s0022 [Sinapis alba]|nr:hypothetical protein N665_0217s0022 [Sinapis alba]
MSLETINCVVKQLQKQNNELLMINSEKRPPGSTPLPEAHTVTETDPEAKHVHHGKPSGRGRGGWRGCGRGSNGRGQDNQQNQGRSFGRGHGRGRGSSFKPQHTNAPTKSVCHKCGMTNHWAKTCRTPKHLVELYQESIKRKKPEAHMVVNDDENDFDHEKDDLMEYETSYILKD